MNDDSWKEISEIQVGESVKSHFVNTSWSDESDLTWLNRSYDGNQFPTGSYVTTSDVVFKDLKNLRYNSMIEMVVDNDSLFAGIDKGYLVYDSLTDKSSFKTILQINANTDYLYDINGELIKVDEVNFYVSSEDGLSFVELDVEDTDTYIINGSTAFNSFVTSNSPCFVEGTPILMEDGSYLNIENVKVGDKVLSFDFKTNESKSSNVLNIFSKKVDKVVKYKFESGKELIGTMDHPIYVIDKGWSSYSDELATQLKEKNPNPEQAAFTNIVVNTIAYKVAGASDMVKAIRGASKELGGVVEKAISKLDDKAILTALKKPNPTLNSFLSDFAATAGAGAQKGFKSGAAFETVIGAKEALEGEKVDSE
jgi:hypothetical protein